MDDPDLMSPLNHREDYHDEFQQERNFGSALISAVQRHCRGEYIPEDLARFCRECAVNLNRDLARLRGEELPTLGYLRDYSV